MDLPAAFVEEMRKMLCGEAEAFFAALAAPPTQAVRLHPSKRAPIALRLEGPVPWEPLGRYVAADNAARPGADIAHFAGAYYAQEASAMAPAAALHLRPGELALDLCAAPGGKATQLAAYLGGEGALVANEPDAARARALSGNMERMGVANAAVISAQPENLAARWPDRFDAVLVDAPCSGEGMFRKDEGARAQWREAAPAGCAKRQSAILRAAARMVRPGGRLVYSTCTFNRLEDEGTVETLLAERDDFAPMDFALPGVGAARGGEMRLWPHKLRGEGHFVAALVRRGEAAARLSPPAAADRAAEAALAALHQALPGPWPERLRGWNLSLTGDLLSAAPAPLPDLSGLHALRRGLHLGRAGKGGLVKPDHALAMWLAPGDAARRVELDDNRAAEFLRGDQLPCEACLAGWTLVCWRGLPLGWGKASQGQIKNHVPKGLRWRSRDSHPPSSLLL